jgi:hypothetical protein
MALLRATQLAVLLVAISLALGGQAVAAPTPPCLPFVGC